MELIKKHLVRMYKKNFRTFYLFIIVILVLIKPSYNTVTSASHYSTIFNLDLSNKDHHINNIRYFLNNINNTIITSLITTPNSMISLNSTLYLSPTIDLKKKSLIEYSPHFIYPPFGYGKIMKSIDQSNENFLPHNSTQFPLTSKNRNFMKLSNKQSDHHNSHNITKSSSSSSSKYRYYYQSNPRYHHYNNKIQKQYNNNKQTNKNRTIEELNSNIIENFNKKNFPNNNQQSKIIDISIAKMPQLISADQLQSYKYIKSRKQNNLLYNSENAINLHQSKSNKLKIYDNIDNNIDIDIDNYSIEFKRKSIHISNISSSSSSTTSTPTYNSYTKYNKTNQYFNLTYNSNNTILEPTTNDKKIQRIKRRSIKQDNNIENYSSTINNINNNNNNNYNPLINDYNDFNDDIDNIKNIQNDDDINRISEIKSTLITNTINLNSNLTINNYNKNNNCINNTINKNIINNSSILLIENCINNQNSSILINNINKNIIDNNNNSNTDYIYNLNNTFNINNNNITILYDENINNNNLSINNNSSGEEECSLECDDCIPCNTTYEEYMQYLYDYIYPSRSEWILIATHCVVFITGLVGNALVCVAVYTNYSMRTVTNVYIVNLAIADFFVILICLPPSVVWDVTETWFLGESMCKIVLYFQSISVTVSVLTLTFISVDRWYAICFPLRYRTKITRAVASVAFIWIVAVVSDVPEFLALQIKPMNSKLRYETVLFTQCQTTWDIETEKNFYIVRLVTLYLLPLLLMTIAYFKIVRVLWKSETIPGHRESRNQHQYTTCGYSRGSQMPASNTSTMGQLRARRKAAKMLVAVVIMFAVCYAPVHTFNLMRYTDTLPHNELTSIFSLLSHWLCYANSAINPIIYNFMSGKFRREFRNALEKCRCARVRVEDRSLNHSTPASRLNNVSPGSRSNYQLTSVRDITRDISRQTMQTTFVENYGNGHSAAIPMLNNEKKDQIT